MKNLMSKELEIRHDFILTASAFYPPFEEEDFKLIAKSYNSVINAIANFGTCELFARQGSRLEVLNFDPDRKDWCLSQIEKYNPAGIKDLDYAVGFLNEYIDTYNPSTETAEGPLIEEYRETMKTIISYIEVKASDAEKLQTVMEESLTAFREGGERGVIEYMVNKLGDLRDLRLQDDRGTLGNLFPWKATAIAVIFCFPVYKVARCLLANKCCSDTLSKIVVTGLTIAAIIASYC